jgi:NhaP-type Na+/H+ or K+/H+ antiporter
MINSFLSLFFFSFVVGTIVGCLSSVFLKNLKSFRLNRVQECSIIVFFAFISYTLTEELGLSPIIALLFTGIFMSHYTFYNLSFQAREESSVVSRIMSNIAEAFVFTYLGLTLLYYMTHALSLSFIIWEIIFVVFGRIVGIFGLAYLMKILNIKSFKIKFSEKGIMSCAGSIRGAIAFGLAISIDTKNQLNKEVLISSTLIMVFFTTIVFGALMPFFIKFFKKYDSDNLLQVDDHHHEEHTEDEGKVVYNFLHPNFSDE